MKKYQKYFQNNEQLLAKLEEIHDKKYATKELIESINNNPFIVEISGLPRTGKSSSVIKIYDFFKKADINIVKTKEPAQIIKDTMKKSEISNMTGLEFNNKTLEISQKELIAKKNSHPSIILQDRGIIDNYFWYQMMYEEKKINETTYNKILLNLYKDLLNIDQLFVLTADKEIIVYRDYINQIYLENRKKTTTERIEKLKQAYDNLLPTIESHIPEGNLIYLDTSNINEIQTSIFIADKMMDGINEKYYTRKRTRI